MQVPDWVRVRAEALVAADPVGRAVALAVRVAVPVDPAEVLVAEAPVDRGMVPAAEANHPLAGLRALPPS